VQTIDRSDTDPESVPAGVVWEAKAAFRQRLEGDLAVLVWDALLDEGAPNSHHHLRFEHPRMWIEVSVTSRASWSSLHGVMHPAAPVRVELQYGGLTEQVVAEVTRSAFRVEHVTHGLMRLHFTGLDPIAPINTDWFYV
jgi:hypothetical protein